MWPVFFFISQVGCFTAYYVESPFSSIFLCFFLPSPDPNLSYCFFGTLLPLLSCIFLHAFSTCLFWVNLLFCLCLLSLSYLILPFIKCLFSSYNNIPPILVSFVRTTVDSEYRFISFKKINHNILTPWIRFFLKWANVHYL